MRVLVVGGGGREHALVHSFAQSRLAEAIFCAPGNAGTSAAAENVAIGADDIAGLLHFALGEHIDLTVVGPEAPLVAGITDLFESNDLKVFGPSREAAQLEGSKAFAKDVMYDAEVADGAAPPPRGAWRRRSNVLPFRTPYPLVVKADGLAAGKGVMICHDYEEAKAAVESCFVGEDVRRGRQRGDHRGVSLRFRGVSAGSVRRRECRAAGTGARLQAHLRRRPGAQYRRHG